MAIPDTGKNEFVPKVPKAQEVLSMPQLANPDDLYEKDIRVARSCAEKLDREAKLQECEKISKDSVVLSKEIADLQDEIYLFVKKQKIAELFAENADKLGSPTTFGNLQNNIKYANSRLEYNQQRIATYKERKSILASMDQKAIRTEMYARLSGTQNSETRAIIQMRYDVTKLDQEIKALTALTPSLQNQVKTTQEAYDKAIQDVFGDNLSYIINSSRIISEKMQQLIEMGGKINTFVDSYGKKPKSSDKRLEAIIINAYIVPANLHHYLMARDNRLYDSIDDVVRTRTLYSDNRSSLMPPAVPIQLYYDLYSRFQYDGYFDRKGGKWTNPTYVNNGSEAFQKDEQEEEAQQEAIDKKNKEYMGLVKAYLLDSNTNREKFKTLSANKFKTPDDISHFCRYEIVNNIFGEDYFENSMSIAIALFQEKLFPNQSDINIEALLSIINFQGGDTWSANELWNKLKNSDKFKVLDSVKVLDANMIYKMDLNTLYEEAVYPLDMNVFLRESGYKAFKDRVLIYEQRQANNFFRAIEYDLKVVNEGELISIENIDASYKEQQKLFNKVGYFDSLLGIKAESVDTGNYNYARFFEKSATQGAKQSDEVARIGYDKALQANCLYNGSLVTLSKRLGGKFETALILEMSRQYPKLPNLIEESLRNINLLSSANQFVDLTNLKILILASRRAENVLGIAQNKALLDQEALTSKITETITKWLEKQQDTGNSDVNKAQYWNFSKWLENNQETVLYDKLMNRIKSDLKINK